MDAAAGLGHAAERSRVWRKFARNPAAIAGALILLVVIGAAIFAPYVAPHEHTRQSLIRRLTPPVWAEGGKATYLLGTDQVGRDILSRMIHAARVSLIVGISAVLVSLTVGVTLGLLSGFLQGRVDTAIMTVVDVTLSFPQLLLALAFVAALGPSLLTIIIVLGLTGWERYTRVVRAEVLALREKDFIEAARAIGASPCARSCATCCPIPSRPSSCCPRCRWPRPSCRRRPCPSWGWGREAPIRPGAI